MEPTHSISSSASSSIPLQNPHFYASSIFLSSKNLTHHSFNLNCHDEEQELDQLDDQTSSDNTQSDNEKEPMFEKPLTPSDVGKLNRLVIPKQHAEKYFPLGGGGRDDDDNKGLLLSFEDESGKCWRFRYSYWNSSQSYVLTKGWSRYVKEKQLYAGDIILFQRHRTDGDRLFIGWRRRGAAVVVAVTATATDGRNPAMGNNSGGGRGLYQGQPYLGHIQDIGANVPYQLDCLHAANDLVQNRGTAGRNPKRLVRLFGVNLECDHVDELPPSTPASSTVSSQGPTTHQFY